MAVFGVPTLHEDDALRAVPRRRWRCARALGGLNAELQTERGVSIADADGGRHRRGARRCDAVFRGGRSAGDAVNVAARLEQAAAPGEILLGWQTLPPHHATRSRSNRWSRSTSRGSPSPSRRSA